MGACIDLMEEALASLARGHAAMPVRSVFLKPDRSGVVGLMPGYIESPPAFGLKAVTVFPRNGERGLDSHQGAVLLFDPETGRPEALLEGGELTAIRTAAASAAATRRLARDDAGDLAILGAGVQGRQHVDAIGRVRKLRRVRIHSRSIESARALAKAVGGEAVASVEDALRGADIVVTATAAKEPILRREWLAPGAHVNAVGACFPTAREIDTETVAAASVFVDSREAALFEAGDLLIPIRERAILPSHIRAEIGAVFADLAPGRTSRDELTLYKSLGVAVEDLAAGTFVLEGARRERKGVSAPFSSDAAGGGGTR
jgi:ornithine cyclodeaminase